MKKRGGKTGDLIDEKPPKLDEKMRKKTDYLLLYTLLLYKGWKTSKTLAKKTVEENRMLIAWG